jgi:cysteinyl-tRNA synthetase
MVRIHNSLTGEKEELKPIVPGRIGMYVCGDTVYDLCHMGHARSKLVFDMVRRYLTWRGLTVNFVRNITDIDDKIIKRAAEQGKDIREFTEYYIAHMHADYDALGILRPDHEPRATEYVPGMIAMIQRLIDNGHAYVAASAERLDAGADARASSGDVMYSVAKFAPYGKLSGKKLSDLRAGARVEVDESKRDPLDFVLWKSAKPGEPSWPSPWGPGRPGWHIECSVMSEQLLGTRFDIHGGGLDLKFPHHENEIAQSRAASGDEFAHLWMHNGFLNIDDEKMSKSLGNFFTIREALRVVRDPEVIRYFVLSSHYRGPLNYSLEQLEQADAALNRIYTALRGLEAPGAGAPANGSAHTARFQEVMDDDFNTPEALAILQTLTREINSARATEPARTAALGAELRSLAGVLGLAQLEPEAWFRSAVARPGAGKVSAEDAADVTTVALTEVEIEQLIQKRTEARKAKNWPESDRIRDQLAASGIIVEDNPGAVPAWRRA